MKKGKLLNELFQWGSLTALAVLAMPGVALAAASGDVNALVQHLGSNEASALPFILGVVAYIGGAFMVVSGALKLKAHAENPAQEKLAPGVARLLVGGLLVSLPTLVGMLQSTTDAGQTAATYSTFNTTF